MIDFTASPGPRALERLQTEQTAWFVTSGKGGVPQPTPVWFLLENDQIVIFSQPNTGKLRAIARNPRVAFHFNFGEGDDDVHVFTGTAEIDADGAGVHESPAYIEKYTGGFTSLGMTPESFAADYSVRVVMTPEKLRGW